MAKTVFELIYSKLRYSDLNKCYEYANDNHISDLAISLADRTDHRDLMIDAMVTWTAIYHTKITVVKPDNKIQFYCSCPAFGLYTWSCCKHVAALFIYLKNQFEKTPHNTFGQFEVRLMNQIQDQAILTTYHEWLERIEKERREKEHLAEIEKNEKLAMWLFAPSVEIDHEKESQCMYAIALKIVWSNIMCEFLEYKPLKRWWYSVPKKLTRFKYNKLPFVLQPFIDFDSGHCEYTANAFLSRPQKFIINMFNAAKSFDPQFLGFRNEEWNELQLIPELLELQYVMEEQQNWKDVVIKPLMLYNEKNIVEGVFSKKNTPIKILQSSDGWYFLIYADNLIVFGRTDVNLDQLKALFNKKLSLPAEKFQTLMHDNTSVAHIIKKTHGTIPGIQMIEWVIDKPIIQINPLANEACIECMFSFIYEGAYVLQFPELWYLKLLDGRIIKRDITRERQIIHDLEMKYNLKSGRFSLWAESDALFDALAVCIDEGITVEFGHQKKILTNVKAKLSASISASIDRFALETALEGDSKNEELIWDALRKKQKYITLKSGEIQLIHSSLQESFWKILALDEWAKDAKQIKVHRAALTQLSENELGIKLTLDKESIALQQQLKNFKEIQEKTLQQWFLATLRPYQQEWYKWLHFLHDYRFSGILADDMGLGKTVQTIALLQSLYENNLEKKNNKSKDNKASKNTQWTHLAPSIVVAPKSVVYNWKKEIEQFAPGLKTQIISSHKDQWLIENPGGTQIFLVSYDICANIIGNNLKQQFLYCIIDEAQRIKNPLTQRALMMCKIVAKHRLALTGTPIENNLMELWSIFQFLMPRFLWSSKNFQKNYTTSDQLKELNKKIKPFILRRTKESVLDDLPPKLEEVVYLEMEDDQKKAYTNLLKTYQSGLLKDMESEWLDKLRFAVLDALLKLRQLCLHPQLTKLQANTAHDSSKLNYLRENIEEMISGGHNVLIFSQFTEFLSYIIDLFAELNISYSYIDGSLSMKEREEQILLFQSGRTKVFLISLKAGWVWLNLTQADYVIHMDPRWNPAVENQATDRAHRIGQRKTVFVQKLIMKDSIEEKILQLQWEKKKLIDDVMGGNFTGSLSQNDIKHIFS